MRKKSRWNRIVVVAGVLLIPLFAQAQGTAFTYQGYLDAGGAAHHGLADFEFSLWNAAAAGTQQGSTQTESGVEIENGLFTVELDFGDQFPGPPRWLQIAVRTNTMAYTTLAPRQRLTATPYAITAARLTGPVSATQLNGTIPSSNVGGTYSSAVTFNNAANTFAGDGSGLSDLDASELTSGTVPAAALDNAWKIGGNTGTMPGTHFVGTADNQALELHVDNVRALRIEPIVGGAPNVIGGAPINYVASGMGGATIAGGGTTNFLGAALTNRVLFSFGTVGGGAQNTAGGFGSTVGGGAQNTAETFYSTLSGGFQNMVSGDLATVGGGWSNIASDIYATIGGGSENTASGTNAVVGGGWSNVASGAYATISGGKGNIASELGGTIGGGADNQAPLLYDTVGGGFRNTAIGTVATVAGGAHNTAMGQGATVGGGTSNTSMFWSATISGGSFNNATNMYATIPGGYSNTAAGAFSFAAGRRAKAHHWGSFVWADTHESDFSSTTTNQFNIRAGGGVRIQSDRGIALNAADTPLITRGFDPFSAAAPAAKQGHGRWGMFMELNALTIGIPDMANRFFHVAKYQVDGSSTLLMSVNQNGHAFATQFNNTSSRETKENFQSLDPLDVLDRVSALPITRWSYKGHPATHIGPVAEDFHAAFAVNGEDNKHIATGDISGVALAAIQGLNQKVEDEVTHLRNENQLLRERLQQLEQLMVEHLGMGSL